MNTHVHVLHVYKCLSGYKIILYCFPYFHCEYEMDFSLQYMKVDGFTAIFPPVVTIGYTQTTCIWYQKSRPVGLRRVLVSVQMHYVHFVYVDYQTTHYCIKKYILVWYCSSLYTSILISTTMLPHQCSRQDFHIWWCHPRF